MVLRNVHAPRRIVHFAKTQHLGDAETLIERTVLIQVANSFTQIVRSWRRGLPEDSQRSGARLLQTRRHSEQGRLSRSVRTNESGHSAFGNCERAVLQSPSATVAFAKVYRFEHGRF